MVRLSSSLDRPGCNGRLDILYGLVEDDQGVQLHFLITARSSSVRRVHESERKISTLSSLGNLCSLDDLHRLHQYINRFIV